MINKVHRTVVTCDHCGKRDEISMSRHPTTTEEENFFEGLREEGWDIRNSTVACPNCDLEMGPFQKTDEELAVEPVYKEELEEDEYNETEELGLARSTGRVFYPNEEFSSGYYLEVERKKDGEKFWVAV
mgnify:CR=1 FL=1